MENLTKVDNFDLIRQHLQFNRQNEFYFIQVIQRKKDGNDVHVSSGYRKIRSFYIYSLEEYDKFKNRIIELCINNNARAYINLNVRNAQEVALECITKYAELVANNNAFMGNEIWDSCCGSTRARGYKTLYLVDIDDVTYKDKIIETINSCRGIDENKIKFEVPTVNGVHLITSGFDLHQFSQLRIINKLPEIDIHKNSPTILYYERRSEPESAVQEER